MTPEEFIKEFEDDQMPEEFGPIMTIDNHDPPFKKGDLRKMHKAGIIVLDDANWTYRLTLKATALANCD